MARSPSASCSTTPAAWPTTRPTRTTPSSWSVLADRLRTWTPRELVAIATAQPPLFAPGERWSYSNTGYILLGLIVEAASGKPLETELRERVFAPLRLRATSFDAGPRIAGRHAHGYSRFGAKRRFDISVINQTWAGAAGAIASTVGDLARFQRALLDGRLLRPDLLAQMRTTVPTGSRVQTYGLGLIRFRHPCGTFWGHGGETLGYITYADSRRAAGARRCSPSPPTRACSDRARCARSTGCGSSPTAGELNHRRTKHHPHNRGARRGSPLGHPDRERLQEARRLSLATTIAAAAVVLRAMLVSASRRRRPVPSALGKPPNPHERNPPLGPRKTPSSPASAPGHLGAAGIRTRLGRLNSHPLDG